MLSIIIFVLAFIWSCSLADGHAASPALPAHNPITGRNAAATINPAPNPLSRTFWFHNSASVDAFLAKPAKGVTAIQIAGYGPTKQAQSNLAHAEGLAVLGGITGSPGLYGASTAASIAYLEKKILDPLIAQKIDGLYVDEPMGQALNDPRECGPGCYNPRTSFDAASGGMDCYDVQHALCLREGAAAFGSGRHL
jgi:hypothetical protein